MDHFASGLEQEGLTPPNSDDMKLLALYSQNRPEWVIAEQVPRLATVPSSGGCLVRGSGRRALIGGIHAAFSVAVYGLCLVAQCVRTDSLSLFFGSL